MSVAIGLFDLNTFKLINSWAIVRNWPTWTDEWKFVSGSHHHVVRPPVILERSWVEEGWVGWTGEQDSVKWRHWLCQKGNDIKCFNQVKLAIYIQTFSIQCVFVVVATQELDLPWIFPRKALPFPLCLGSTRYPFPALILPPSESKLQRFNQNVASSGCLCNFCFCSNIYLAKQIAIPS